MEQGEAAAAEYVNLQQVVSYVVAVGDLVAYVDDKKQQDGFKNEYEVRWKTRFNLQRCSAPEM